MPETIKIQSKKEWRIKTEQERVVPLSNEAVNILRELYEKRKVKWVFSNTDKPVKDIRHALKTAAKRAGITKLVAPNMLRHTFACHSLKKGADLQAVSEILGDMSNILCKRLIGIPASSLLDSYKP
ncbi:MAG: tyrosine-type recombinase/integrase [Nitrospirae bacterium]|nr:tyrosine-type recombinase/integrase [Nitrospirota bacterium]